MVKVLFVDDDPQAHKTLQAVLPGAYTLVSAFTGRDGETAAARERPDVVLLDIGLPDIDGIEVLKRLASKVDAPPVIMLTALSDVKPVKEAILAGARDYIVKPYKLAELEGTIRRAVRFADTRPLAKAIGAGDIPEIVGESAPIRSAKTLILRYAASDSPVLIQGESGTGKELAAKSLHGASRRSAESFVALNCGALPESLLETELFGSEKGAYTDAVARPGSFERANGGTLFLDEIGELSLRAQTRLLRVLEEKTLTRVGGSRPVESDVRIVSATNRDLKTEVKKGVFREDLYYRLSVLPVRMPPLRERQEDIPLIAFHLLSILTRKECFLTDGARGRLISHAWPGNVRELRNALERSLLACGRSDADGNMILDDILLD
jgi:DNA-binding NtrC family response regulator